MHVSRQVGSLMDMQVVKKGLEITRRKKKWVLVLTALGFTSYGVYRVYHLPSVVKKGKRLFKLLGAFISIAEAISDSADTIETISKDLKEFLQSDSDQIPKSLRQISKITQSQEFSQSLIWVTQALTIGFARGYRYDASVDPMTGNSGFTDHVMDKLLTQAGTGFASIVVGSFARNLVMAFYSSGQSVDGSDSETSSLPWWVDAVCSDKCRSLIGDCIRMFVSTAVAVYLDKTMNINPYDQILSGLTNPKHDTKVRDVLVSVCNGAVETFVKTSHQILTSSDYNKNGSLSIPPRPIMNGNFGLDALSNALQTGRKSFNAKKNYEWVSKMSSTLAVPSNRRLVLDVTGRVTFETVRSFMTFLLERIYQGLKRSVQVVQEAVIERGAEVVRYVAAKSSVVATICISLCLHILGSVWILDSA